MTQAPAARPGIAVIVPVLHDYEAFVALCEDLAAQSHQPTQILVVDAGADARLRDLCEQRNFSYLQSRALRGLQLDKGARAADSEVLWFVHADARLPRDACAAVADACSSGTAGGCLQFRFQGQRGPMQRLIERLVRLRIALGGIAYGDQALFCTRAAYITGTGFAHAGLFEEVPFVRSLRAGGGFSPLRVPVYVSRRRWERDGWLRRSLRNRWLALRHACGAAPQSLADVYDGPTPESRQ